MAGSVVVLTLAEHTRKVELLAEALRVHGVGVFVALTATEMPDGMLGVPAPVHPAQLAALPEGATPFMYADVVVLTDGWNTEVTEREQGRAEAAGQRVVRLWTLPDNPIEAGRMVALVIPP